MYRIKHHLETYEPHRNLVFNTDLALEPTELPPGEFMELKKMITQLKQPQFLSYALWETSPPSQYKCHMCMLPYAKLA